jgi:ketosteroid isomerase-like protein
VDRTEVAVRSVAIMADGDRAAFDTLFAPGAVNHEARAEPPAARAGGPDGFHASALRLRAAFADLAFEVHHTAADGDLVVVDATMSGRHVGPFVVHGADGGVERAWAPTGRSFAVRHAHWLRVPEDRVTEHWAVRDDLGQGVQLGWVPPTPAYLLRCALATRRARRAA